MDDELTIETTVFTMQIPNLPEIDFTSDTTQIKLTGEETDHPILSINETYQFKGFYDQYIGDMILLSENEQESQLMTEEAKKAIDQAGTKTKCLLWTDKCIRFRAVDLADKIELPSVPIDEPTQ